MRDRTTDARVVGFVSAAKRLNGCVGRGGGVAWCG